MVNAEGKGQTASLWYTFQATLLHMVTRRSGRQAVSCIFVEV